MHDTLMNGRKVRVMNIIDDYNREALAIKADYSQSGHSLVKALIELAEQKTLPEEIRCDNGPEFFLTHSLIIAILMELGLSTFNQENRPKMHLSNDSTEPSERIFWMHICLNLYHLRKLAQEWLEEYNNLHPHQSLNNLSPLGYLQINHQI